MKASKKLWKVPQYRTSSYKLIAFLFVLDLLFKWYRKNVSWGDGLEAIVSIVLLWFVLTEVFYGYEVPDDEDPAVTYFKLRERRYI
jgi:hypothetical protein